MTARRCSVSTRAWRPCGAFELRAPSERPTEWKLGVTFVPWLLAAIDGSADASVDTDEVSGTHESVPLQLEPLALERQPLTPTLRAFLTLGGYLLRECLPSHAVAATLGNSRSGNAAL